MANEEVQKLRYSDEELEEFKVLIEGKLKAALEEYTRSVHVSATVTMVTATPHQCSRTWKMVPRPSLARSGD